VPSTSGACGGASTIAVGWVRPHAARRQQLCGPGGAMPRRCERDGDGDEGVQEARWSAVAERSFTVSFFNLRRLEGSGGLSS
jgi:hypothetical protein